MEEKQLRNYEGKEVRILLRNGYTYRGKVVEIGESTLSLFDKFENNIIIDLNAIEMISDIYNEKGKVVK